MGVPGIVNVDGTDCVISLEGWSRHTNGVEILRLEDGNIVGLLPGLTSCKGSIMGSLYALSDGTIVNYLGTKGHYDGLKLTGWRLAMNDHGRVQATQSWQLDRVRFFTMMRAAWRGTDLYSSWNIVDGSAGQVVTEERVGKSMRAPFKGRSGVHLLAGKHYVQGVLGGGKFAFWNLETGELDGIGSIPENPADGATTEQKCRQAGRTTWRWLGGATPFAYRDRLYVRAYDFLWCMEEKP
jgi:hypothetical protein